ncbi:hypothetical protein BWI15_21505 [Kribbella sp. ALI-6-A]|uniref:hypothetical protein n=1 Tax=Kribbella sp. ALI-6-A TaxID=1933817 RepID=UPI00097C28DD|nr:hypothetical protein [Kribbella sp. ALI-6-A]ONI69200.1 hypothetical protein BWI15_21505 [Kribbella sp. ALI-6-A]
MTEPSDDQYTDQDSEPTMTAPTEGRPDGTEASQPTERSDDDGELPPDDAQGTRRKEGYFEQPE